MRIMGEMRFFMSYAFSSLASSAGMPLWSARSATAFISVSMASSSARSVVIICCSSLDALMMTGTLLLLLEISASPRSNWVMLRISVRVSFKTSLTYSASSGSRLRMILVLLLLRMARP